MRQANWNLDQYREYLRTGQEPDIATSSVENRQGERLGSKTINQSSKAKSIYEESLNQQMTLAGLHYEREHKFHPRRGWRFDFAWLPEMLAVEVEGGIWSNGNHNRGRGFIEDAEKYNTAALMGWTVLRIPQNWICSNKGVECATALNLIIEALETRRRRDETK